MNTEYAIIAYVWGLSLLLWFLIPRAKRRLAVTAFLFKQMITYPLGLLVVEYDLLAYPVRLLPEINRASLTFEFWAYPILCAFFNAHFPEKHKWWVKLGYYASFCSALTVTEIFLENHTNLIRYIQWNAAWTWVSLYLTFFITRSFCAWFWKRLPLPSSG
ncbi:CBO0543 family protein [Paenibacillus turpanensis]|uniref:CBO0543 family protein n=1 Tax=Paenibacillus turpanensis TaxID=2689078 RepID=UPI001407C138|nr:CBO0543 family protein [Paenibacillus turpanensis]